MSIPFIDLPSMHAEVQDNLNEAWSKVHSSGQFIGGEAVENFESAWADYCGTKYCIAVGSGTAALELTLSAMGIGRGDEVIVPANTFFATAAAVATVGARVVFVEVAPSTLLITAEIFKQAITSRTAAVIAVHLYGQPADMDSVNQAASSAGIAVIEDAAQAHGACWRGKKAGSLSNAGCFSFYPTKNLGAFGDAGAVVTDDYALAERIRSLSNHGRSRDNPHRHELVGANHRLDALQASILSVKLKRLDAWNAGRKRAAESYSAALAHLPVQLVDTAPEASSSNHLFVVQTPYRDKVRQALAAEQIFTGLHYPVPCHRQKPFITEARSVLPVVETAADRILSLPIFPHLTDSQIGCIAESLSRALSQVDPHEPPQPRARRMRLSGCRPGALDASLDWR